MNILIQINCLMQDNLHVIIIMNGFIGFDFTLYYSPRIHSNPRPKYRHTKSIHANGIQNFDIPLLFYVVIYFNIKIIKKWKGYNINTESYNKWTYVYVMDAGSDSVTSNTHRRERAYSHYFSNLRTSLTIIFDVQCTKVYLGQSHTGSKRSLLYLKFQKLNY